MPQSINQSLIVIYTLLSKTIQSDKRIYNVKMIHMLSVTLIAPERLLCGRSSLE